MMAWRERCLAALALASLASCGGDGAGGGGSLASVVTPTPTPTPTPTASPFAYASAADFTRDRSFTAIGFQLTFASGVASVPRLDAESPSVGFDFTASTRTYQARYGAASVTAATMATGYTPSTDEARTTGGYFTRSYFTLSYNAEGLLIPATWFGYVVWSEVPAGQLTSTRYLLFGARTVSGDVPATGIVTVAGRASLKSTLPYGGDGGDASAVIDFAARTITGTTLYYPPELGSTGISYRLPPVAQPVTFTGTLDPATGRISGTATNTANGATGNFEGALYGPRGQEVALLVTMTGSDGTIYYGVVGMH